jgi:uncharacterized membrane protein YedE/YeeE
MLARCPWYIAGPLLGVLIVTLRLAVNRPLGALGGYIDLAHHAARPWQSGFSAVLLIGIVIGGAVFAGVTNTFSPSMTYAAIGILPSDPVARLALLALAGVVMGIGARRAGGCTSGHGMTGMALASPASVVASVTFFATAVVLAHVFVWIMGGAS